MHLFIIFLNINMKCFFSSLSLSILSTKIKNKMLWLCDNNVAYYRLKVLHAAYCFTYYVLVRK